MSDIDRAIMLNRSMPLSREELAGFGPEREKKGCTIRPYAEFREIKVKGKRKIVPFVGIQGTF